jgi:hypothetical protein
VEVLLVIAVFGFALAVTLWQSADNKERINEYLLSKGASNITISWVWPGDERGSQTYNVKYTDRRGGSWGTRCKVAGWFSGSKIYWREPPSV